MISWVTFYSFTGSFQFNRYLRNQKVSAIRSNIESRESNLSEITPIFYNGMVQMINMMKDTPALDNDYDIYRFIWDDTFLINMKEGDIFIDKGFVSTTRDPFYSPGLNGNFGLILLKIQIPKNKKGVGLFIENFSLFPKEEEFLLPPNSKLKLISKNDNFKYYHTNPQFEKLINRKYEFILIPNDTIPSYKLLPIIPTNNYHMIDTININGIDRIDMIGKFIKEYASDDKTINLKVGKSNKIFKFIYQWFDSTSSYEKFYYNKIKDGILFSIFDNNGYMLLNIELGETMVVNYLNSLYFGNNNIDMYKINDDILELIYHFGRIFYYKTAIIYHEYKSFSVFGKDIFLYLSQFNNTIYDYLKNKKKYLDFNPFIEYKIGYWYLDEYFSKKPEESIIERIPEKERSRINNNGELLIHIIEKYFYLYPKIIELMDKNIFSNSFVTFNIYDKLVVDGIVDNFKPNITYTNDNIVDNDFKLIFRQPIRRI